MKACVVLVSAVGFASSARAESVTLNPVADTTLVQTAADNNLGHTCFFNAGTTGTHTKNRGLMQFDLTGIPRGAVITRADVVLTVTKAPDGGGAASVFALHRVLRPWGEGVHGVPDCPPQPFQSPGLGEPATMGEATWNNRLVGTAGWGAPGGLAGTDFVAAPSTSAFVSSAGDSYQFESSSELVADVQTWVNAGADNFGWMLISQDEGTAFTARRFGSREDAGAAPTLVVEFQIVPEPSVWTLGLGLSTGLLWLRRRGRA